LGVRETNPQAEVRVVWTNTWFGPQQEKEAAEALLAEGADVIAQHQDTTEPQKAAAEAGKVSIGYDSDMRQFVGDTVLVSPIWNWGLKYVDIAKKVMKGIYAAESYYGDISEGIVDLASLSPRVDQTTANNIVLFRAAMRDKWWDVFCGEVVGQNGVAVQAKGNCLTLEELLSMDWFVEGVKGEAPGVAKEGLGSPNPMANHKPGVYKPSLVIILTTFGYQLKDGSWAGESGPFLNVMLPGGAQDVSTDLPWCDKAILGELHGQKVLQITAGTTKLPASGCAHDLVRSKYMEENPWIVQTGISGFSPRIGGFVGPDGKQVAGDYTEIGDICISEVGVDWDLGFSSMTQQVFWPLTWPSPAQYYKGSEFLAQLLYQTASYVEWPMPPDAPRSNIEKYFGPGSARLPKVWYGNCAESTGDNFWHDRVSDLHARTVVAEGLTKAHGQLLTSDQVFAVTAMENSGLFYTISRWASLTGKQVLFAYARSSSNFDQPWLNPDGSEAVDPATSISDGMDLGGDQFGSLTEFLLIDRWLERLQ
jgi:purine nucleoside permease